MKTFLCSVAQNGFFAGPVHFLRSNFAEKEQKTTDVEKELQAFRAAVHLLQEHIRSECSSRLPGFEPSDRTSCENSAIRETVLSILTDEAFLSRVENTIRNQLLTAPSALRRTAEEFSDTFRKMDSDYLRSRQDDLCGAANELIKIIEGADDKPQELSAFVAARISPAELFSADAAWIGGLLTEKGSSNSHAAILAGNMGIPYLYGSSEAVAYARNASFIILNSVSRTVTIDPDPETRKAAAARMMQEQAERKKQTLKRAVDTARCRTKVCANIAGPGDIDALLTSDADGVGLFRTEFLFLGRDSAPNEEEQYHAYRSVLDAMGDKPVVIRAMDIGSDKNVPWLAPTKETNPALGLRGVRVLLAQDSLFHTQLRALLRAGVSGNLKVMFPMIASAWEIDAIKERIQKAAHELTLEGTAFKMFPLGIMVETPAAAVCAEELADKVSFFSIGTNDLTQYTLAIDREAEGLDPYFNPYHSAVFKLIEMTAAAAHAHGAEAALCGQLAADPQAIDRLIRLGIDELSVPVRMVNETKRLAALAEEKLSAAEKTAESDSEKSSTQNPEIGAAADGELIPMCEIPDEMFSSGKLGKCIGILPSNGKIYAPVSGTISHIADSRHALEIASDSGNFILVHVGIDTVKLGGKPFRLHVCQGTHVERGQLIMEADLHAIRRAGLSATVVVAVLRS